MVTFHPGRRAKVAFTPDDDGRETTSTSRRSTSARTASGRRIQGNRSASADRAAAPTRKPASTRRTANLPPEKVVLRCDICEWTKPVSAEKVVASLQGHYGYMHPQRRKPDPDDCRRQAAL